MTRVGMNKFTCPNCSKEFISEVLRSTNFFGKRTTDFYQQSEGIPPLHFMIHTCPQCGFTEYDEKFQKSKTISEHIKTIIHDRITPIIGKRKPSIGEKYEFLAWISEAEGKSSLNIGQIYLTAAWCIYDLRHYEVMPMELVEVFDEQKKAECEKMNREARLKFGTEEALEKEEKYYRRRAIEYFEQAYNNKNISPEVVYLIGEQYRRIGEIEKANKWFDLVSQYCDQSPQEQELIKLAEQQRTQPKEYLDI